MLDDIPAHWILLVALAAFAIAPARYIFDYIRHSPRHRDITQPDEDLAWRNRTDFAISAAILSLLLAIAVFAVTRTEELERSDGFPSLLFLAVGGFCLFETVRHLHRRHAVLMIKGLDRQFDRETQPRRYWATIVWNLSLSGVILAIPLVIHSGREAADCENRGERLAREAQVAACSSAIATARNGWLDRVRSTLGLTGQDTRVARLYLNRGYARHRMQDYQPAIADYDAAIARVPDDSYALYNRGLAYDALEQHEHALRDYSASLALRPDNGDAYFFRGMLYWGASRPDDAIADLTRAHELDPESIPPLAQRGVIYVWQGNPHAAHRDFARIEALSPGSNGLLRGEAMLAFRNDDPLAAIAKLTQLLHIYPDDRTALRMRADLYWDTGKEDSARDDDDRIWALAR
jgi:tetratricopeptide (TPR) repeat protein